MLSQDPQATMATFGRNSPIREDFYDEYANNLTGDHRECEVCGAQYTSAQNIGSWKCRGLNRDHYNSSFHSRDKNSMRIPVAATIPGSSMFYNIRPEAVVKRVEISSNPEISYLIVARSADQAAAERRNTQKSNQQPQIPTHYQSTLQLY